MPPLSSPPRLHLCVIRSLFLHIVLLLSLFLAIGQGQMVLDGSLGRSGSLRDPDYVIPAEAGRIRGSNLFHSFRQFNVRTGESATFTGPASIANILSRVTGGQQSFIDGLLQSEIPGANLYLLNPSGVVFGPNATLDVKGSFHVSTAEILRFADGATFVAQLSEKSTLTVAPPTAFGFLEPQPAPIAVQQSTLRVPPGETLSMVGGDITIAGNPALTSRGFPTLSASGGRLNLASVASAGEVRLDDPRVDVSSFTQLGAIDIAKSGFLNVSGQAGGSVVIRGGRLSIDNTFIAADSGNKNGAKTGVDIKADSINIDNGALIRTVAFGAGHGGDLVVKARRLSLNGAGQLFTATVGTGAGGDVTIVAEESIAIAGRDSEDFQSAISTATTCTPTSCGRGDAGRIDIRAPVVIIDDGLLASSTETAGSGGDLNVQAGQVILLRGGGISNSVGNSGLGGKVTITATEEIRLAGHDASGEPSIILSASTGSGDPGRLTLSAPSILMEGGVVGTQPLGTGRTAEINIQVGRLTLTDEGQIFSTTRSTIPAGTITIMATEEVFIAERGGILATTADTGSAGNIRMTVRQLMVSGGGQIDSSSLGEGPGGTVYITATDTVNISGQGSGIVTNAGGRGRGGDIRLHAQHIALKEGAVISAQSTETGDAGGISLTAHEVFWSANSAVTTEAAQANGGNIEVSAQTLIRLRDSRLTTAVGSGEGDGGNIAIDSEFAILEGSQMSANAFGGPGGNITVTAGVFLVDPTSSVTASSARSVDGEIDIRAPVTNLSGIVVPLPQRFTQAAALLRQQCAERLRGGQVSSFVIVGRDGVPADPEGGLPSPLAEAEGLPVDEAERAVRLGRAFASGRGLVREEDSTLQIRRWDVLPFSQAAWDAECVR